MKKIILITLALCAALSVSAFCVFSAVSYGKSFRGSGKIVTSTIDAPQFDAIYASRAVKVVITDDASGKITIAADDNVMDLVVVKESRGELRISISNRFPSIQNANVTVTVPAPGNNYIRSLRASSASKINSTVVLSAPDFSMRASSSATIAAAVKSTKCQIRASSDAKIKAAIDTDACRINASSAANIKLTGLAENCTAKLSSSSRLSADSFVVERYRISTSSDAGARINCSKHLNASASSSSSIDYLGTPTEVEVSKSSSGSIRRK